MKVIKKKQAIIFPYILILVLSLVLLWPFFKKGFFETHDGDWMIIRFSAFHQALVDGQFPVRFVDRLNNNYGYPVLNFLYPLPFYLAEIPKILGFGFVDSIKVIFTLSTIFSSVLMYWALSLRFSKFSSIVGAVIYLWTPYRLLDLYVRGSLGENLAFTFIPLILGSIFQIGKGKKIYYPLLSVSLALLILSHNVIAIIFVPLFFLLYALELKEKLKLGITYFILGTLISSFFWIPALYDLRFVIYNQVQVSNVFDYLTPFKSLLVPSWSFGPSPNGTNSFSPRLGLLPILIITASIVFLISGKLKDKLAFFLTIISITAVFFTLRISTPVWKILPYINNIQFPWRLLSVIVFASAVLSAFIAEKVNKRILSSLLIISAVILNFSYTFPRIFVDKEDGFYSTNEATTTVQNEYMPIWVKKIPEERASAKIEIENGGTVEKQDIGNSSYKASIILNENSRILVNTIFFPGWTVISDDRNVPIEITEVSGLISFKLPKGIHKVIIDYRQTGIHSASELLSLIALILVSIQFFRWRKQNSL